LRVIYGRAQSSGQWKVIFFLRGGGGFENFSVNVLSFFLVVGGGW